MSKDQWIADVERSQDQYSDGKLSLPEFSFEMKHAYPVDTYSNLC